MRIHIYIISLLLLLPTGAFSQGDASDGQKTKHRQQLISLSTLTQEQKDFFFDGDSVVRMPTYQNSARARSAIAPKFPDENNINYGTRSDIPVVLPTLSGNDYFTFEFDTRRFPGLVGAQDVGKAYFLLHVPEPMCVSIHNYDSELAGTIISVFAENLGGEELPFYPENDPSYYQEWIPELNKHSSYDSNNPLRLSWTHRFFNMPLMPGDYLIATYGVKVSNASPHNGPMRIVFRTSMQPDGLNMPMRIGQDPHLSYNVREVGTKTSFENSYATEKFWNTYGNEGKDIHHIFYIAADSVDVTFTVKSGQSQPTSVYLFQGKGYNHPILSATAQAGASNGKSTLKRRLKPGQYMVVAEGGDPALSDLVSVNIQGAVPKNDPLPETGLSIAEAINLGTFAADFSADDTRNTAGFRNNYGTPANEVYHKFTLTRQMRVSLSHTAGLEDTRLFLLKHGGGSSYTLIDQIHGPQSYTAGATGNRADLSAVLDTGTYIVISEGGNNTNGTMSLRASGTVNYYSGSSPMLSDNKNYIYSVVPNLQVSSPDGLALGSGGHQVSYFDGLGRTEQQAQIGTSPDLQDLTTLQQYDRQGRPSSSWLPIPMQGRGGYTAPSGLISAAQGYYGDDYPYSIPSYENSPFDRVSKQCGPGVEWHANNKTANYQYRINDSGSAVLTVHRFTTGATPDNPVLTDAGLYPNARLTVVYATDEDGHATYTFTDNGGKTLLSRQIGDNAEHLDTYYVYDDFGNLCFVLPPEASAGITSSDLSERTNKYGYKYRYDNLNRCVAKKLPGVEWTYMVYDRAGRLLFTQDGEQRASGQWLCTLSDPFGRPAVSGLYSGNVDPETFGAVPVSVHFDPQAAYGYFVDGPVNISQLEIRSVNYYDTYRFRDCVTAMSNSSLDYDPFSGGIRCGTDDDPILHKGLLTGSVVAVVGSESPRMVYTVNYYDDRKRMIQSHTINPLGGLSTADIRYDFAGNILAQRESHSLSANSPADELVKTFTYDHASRLLSESSSLNASAPATVCYAYDQLGRLLTLTQGSGANAVTSTHTYNIRGWLTAKSSPLFDMALRYTSALHGGQVSYTGNIAEWQWKHQDQTDTHTYAFAYDPIARLKGAYHYTSAIRDYRFEERDIDYDKNSNIRSLTTTDQTAAADSRTYTYSGNQLTNMSGGTYAYDLNGNMTRDGENNLILKYNRLNLIEKIEKNGATLANYSYLWEGTKLSAINGSGNGLYYLGSLVYNKQGNTLTLESARFNGGRIVATGKDYDTHYFLTDHLGSTRVVANSLGTVVEQNDYNAYGNRWGGEQLPGNRYLYNGKENQSFVNVPYLDYGWRMYDPQRRMWSSVDAFAGKYFSTSPYAYCLNNPIRFIDPFGLDAWTTNDPKVINQFITQLYSSGTFNVDGMTHYTDEEFLNSDPAGDQYLNQIENGDYYFIWKTKDKDGVQVNAYRFPRINKNTSSAGDDDSDYLDASGHLIAVAGILTGIGSETMFSRKLGTWMGKDRTLRSQAWGGNAITGGKFRYAAKVSKYFSWAGYGTTALGLYNTEAMYRTGLISNEQRWIEHGSTAMSAIPFYGTAWAIGWEAGKICAPLFE